MGIYNMPYKYPPPPTQHPNPWIPLYLALYDKIRMK